MLSKEKKNPLVVKYCERHDVFGVLCLPSYELVKTKCCLMVYECRLCGTWACLSRLLVKHHVFKTLFHLPRDIFYLDYQSNTAPLTVKLFSFAY